MSKTNFDILKEAERHLGDLGLNVEVEPSGVLEYERGKLIEIARRAEKVRNYLSGFSPTDYIPLEAMYFQVFGKHMDTNPQEAFQALIYEVPRLHIIYSLVRTEEEIANPGDDDGTPNQAQTQLIPTDLGEFYTDLYSEIAQLWPTRGKDTDSSGTSVPNLEVPNIYSLISNILQATSIEILNGQDNIRGKIRRLKPTEGHLEDIYALHMHFLQEIIRNEAYKPLEELYELIYGSDRTLLIAVPGRYILGLDEYGKVTVKKVFYQKPVSPNNPFDTPNDSSLDQVTVALVKLPANI